jgi:hypothetical protein
VEAVLGHPAPIVKTFSVITAGCLGLISKPHAFPNILTSEENTRLGTTSDEVAETTTKEVQTGVVGAREEIQTRGKTFLLKDKRMAKTLKVMLRILVIVSMMIMIVTMFMLPINKIKCTQ